MQRVAAARTVTRIAGVDLRGPVVRLERLAVAAEGVQRDPPVGQHGRIRAVRLRLVAQRDRLFVYLARLPCASTSARRRLASLYDAHFDGERRIVPVHPEDEFLGGAVGGAPVDAGVCHCMDDVVALGYDRLDVIYHLAVKHVAEPALVQSRSQAADCGYTHAGHHRLAPCHVLDILERAVLEDHLERVVLGVGLDVGHPEVLAHLLDRGREADGAHVKLVRVAVPVRPGP